MRYLMKFWQKATAFVVAEVPDAMAACEFDCRELHCQEGQWRTCHQRVRTVHAIADTAHAALPTGADDSMSSQG